MRSVKQKSTQKCSYCKLRAQWMSGGLTLTRYACETHKPALQQHEAQKAQSESADHDHMTEGDRQSWGRL